MKYRGTRNRVTNKIRSAKAKYNRHLIEEHSDNPSSFWKNNEESYARPS